MRVAMSSGEHEIGFLARAATRVASLFDSVPPSEAPDTTRDVPSTIPSERGNEPAWARGVPQARAVHPVWLALTDWQDAARTEESRSFEVVRTCGFFRAYLTDRYLKYTSAWHPTRELALAEALHFAGWET